MRFENFHLVWIALAVPLVFLLNRLRARRRTAFLDAVTERSLQSLTIAGAEALGRAVDRRAIWAGLLVLCLVAAIFRPQWGFTWRESSKKGVDIVIAVDVSESMLAIDVKPNRLERARREIIDLIEQFRGDRVGLVAFAGVGFTETPLTLDYGTLLGFVSGLSPNLIPIKGTNIERAVRESIRNLDKGALLPDDSTQSSRARAVILITDGEEFDGNLAAVQELAAEKNVKLYIIGVGTAEGGPIQTGKGYKKDKDGKVIISKLSVTALQALAEATGGAFVTSLGTDQDTQAIYANGILRDLERSEISWARAKQFHEYFQVPLLLAVIVMLLGPWGIGTVRLNRAREQSARAQASAALLAVGLLLGFAVDSAAAQIFTESPEQLGADGVEKFQAGEFPDALAQFEQGLSKRQDDYRLFIGKGAAAYRLGQFEEAEQAFTAAAELAELPQTQAEALYNAGNSLVQQKRFEPAIKFYEKSLTLNPKDKEATDNLAYARRLLELQQKQQNQDEQQDQQQNQSDKSKSEQDSGEGKSETSSGNDSSPNEDQQKQSDGSKNQEDNQQSNEGQESNQNQQPQDQNQDQQNSNSGAQQEQDSEQGEKDENQPDKDQAAGGTDKNNSPADGSEPREGKEPEGSEQQGQGESSDDPSDSSPKDSAGQAQTEAGNEEAPELSAESRMKLDSVEEKRNARFNYRFNKAMRQLKQNQESVPEKDW